MGPLIGNISGQAANLLSSNFSRLTSCWGACVEVRAEKAKIEWVRIDMRDFIRDDTFDLVLSMYTSFGYFDDKNEDLRVLDNIIPSLRPGGVCLIDLMGKECVARILQPTTSDVLPHGTTLVRRHEIFDNWTRIRNEWILTRKGKARTFKFYHTVYSGQELKDRMAQIGFTDAKLFGNLDGDEYGANAQRLIVVGHKPNEPEANKY